MPSDLPSITERLASLVRPPDQAQQQLLPLDPFPEVPQLLDMLDKLERRIAAVDNFSDLNLMMNTAAAIHRTYKPVYKDVSDRAGEVWVSAEIRVGEELERLPAITGKKRLLAGRKKGSGGRAKADLSEGTLLELSDKNAPTLAEIGIARKRAARAKRLFKLPAEHRQLYVSELKSEDKAITPGALLQKDRQHRKRDIIHELSTAAFSEDGPFDVVVIDPPWDMEKIDREAAPDQAAFDYPVMSEAEIAEFWPREIAPRLKPDVHVFCWTTNKLLPVAFRLIEGWGLRYVLTMVWHKPGGFQPFGLPQYNCEFAVYARLGAPLFVETKDFPCCFSAPRREHSRKPDFFYDLIRRVTGGSRIDVFSRQKRPGFAQYGNEAGKFSDVA